MSTIETNRSWTHFRVRMVAFLRRKFKCFIASINRDDLTTLCELIMAGRIKPVIDSRYPITQTAEATAYVEEGNARAKVLITFQ